MFDESILSIVTSCLFIVSAEQFRYVDPMVLPLEEQCIHQQEEQVHQPEDEVGPCFYVRDGADRVGKGATFVRCHW